MIKSFGNQLTEDIYNDTRSKESRKLDVNLHEIARRKLDWIHSANGLLDLRMPPGNRLESLKGDRAGYHSIRINNKWRIIFKWISGNAEEVSIEDYH